MNFNYNSAQLAPLHNRKLVEFILPYLSFVQHDRSNKSKMEKTHAQTHLNFAIVFFFQYSDTISGPLITYIRNPHLRKWPWLHNSFGAPQIGRVFLRFQVKVDATPLPNFHCFTYGFCFFLCLGDLLGSSRIKAKAWSADDPTTNGWIL